MNYTEFINAMKQEVTKQMGSEIKVDLHTSTKNNGIIRQGLVLITRNINISPTIYMEEFYEKYQSGEVIATLAQTVCRLYEQVKQDTSYPSEELLTYNRIKDKIVCKLIDREKNKELLRKIPYETYLNLAVVFYVLIENTRFGSATFLIKNENLKDWKVDKKEIADKALKNAIKLLPMEIIRLTDYMYVMSNKQQNLGAAVAMYPGACERAGNLLEDNYYMIPSSVHEMILIPEGYGLGRKELLQLVKEINETEVSEEEVLSDQVYYYSRKDGILA